MVIALAVFALQACAGTPRETLFRQPSYIVLRTPPYPETFATVGVRMARYDRATGALSEYAYGYSLSEKSTGAQWRVFNVPAGEYVLMAADTMRGQNIWSIFFDAATYAVTVRDGEIVYMGQLDLAPTLAELNEQLEAQWRPAAPGVMMYVCESASEPRLLSAQPTSDDLARIRAALPDDGRASKLPLRWAAPQPARYTRSRHTYSSCTG